MRSHAYRPPYCLHCYAPLGEVISPSTPCPACGRPNLVVDLRRLWTRERKVREIEQLLKAIIVVVIGSISLLALLHPGIGTSGHGHGMAAGAPILLGILLWDAASITQRESLFRGSIIWPIVGGVFLLPAVAFALAVPQPLPRGIAVLVALACVAGLLSPLTRRRWLAWREAHIEGA